jgi:integral membrane protein (TIGR00529 family)
MFAISAITKVLSVFGLILVLNRLKIELSIALLSGSLILGIWMNLGPRRLLESGLGSLTDLQTISLIMIVGIILLMSRLMQKTGHLDRIVASFSALSKDPRVAGSVMPALIGLLPMPGGALFSAPMVDTALCKNKMSREEKTAVNYWFRHIWEYWWPLYPGVVLAVALLKVEVWRFMAVMIPMTLVSVFAGTFFILRPLGRTQETSGRIFSSKDIRGFLWEIMPILIVVGIILALGGLTGLLGVIGIRTRIPGSVSILPGLVASTVWICFVNRIKMKTVFHEATSKGILPMLILVASIMVFKGIMNDSKAVIQIRDELLAYRIPIIMVILLMPFLSGLITGIAIGFVGTSFPLIIPMLPAPDLFTYLSWAALAYTFGYMGMMLSPVHLCFLVTKDYFKAGLARSYRYLFLPVVAVMVTALLLFIATRLV